MNAALINDFIGATGFGAMFAVLLVLAEYLRRRRRVGPETTRKLVHVGGGLLSLALPWLVSSPAIVFGMSLALAGLLLYAQHRRALRSLHGVSRHTGGTAYFPLAVGLVYLITYDRYWLFVCAMLVLAVADAFAALIGSSYGRRRYEVEDELKSLEGSMVFLVIAFLALHLPMLLMTGLPREVCVLAALLVAVLVTGFEAVSMGGADNLFIPLGVAVILTKITAQPLSEIVYQNLSLLALGIAVSLAARRTKTFNAGATIMFALFTYGAWSLGSERWALPILTGFVAYSGLRIAVDRISRIPSDPVRPRILFRVLIIPLLLLVIGNMTGQAARFYAPFVMTLAVIFLFGSWSHLLQAFNPGGSRRHLLSTGTAIAAWISVGLPAWLAAPRPVDGRLLILAAVILLVAGRLDNRQPQQPTNATPDHLWPARRVILVIAAAVVILLAQSTNA